MSNKKLNKSKQQAVVNVFIGDDVLWLQFFSKNRKNINALEREKGIIEKVPSNNIYKGFKYSNGESSLFLGNNKLLSFQIFEFLADNTYVEYSLVQNNFYCLITSSHDRETDKLMTKILEYSENETEQRRKERLYFLSIMQYFVHNHRIIAEPSPSDMEMKEYILSVNSNIILEIYIRGSYYDYDLNKKRQYSAILFVVIIFFYNKHSNRINKDRESHSYLLISKDKLINKIIK